MQGRNSAWATGNSAMRKSDGYAELHMPLWFTFIQRIQGQKHCLLTSYLRISPNGVELDNFWNCAGGIYLKMIGRHPEKEKLYIYISLRASLYFRNPLQVRLHLRVQAGAWSTPHLQPCTLSTWDGHRTWLQKMVSLFYKTAYISFHYM